jgi:ubiquinone/menaquinone biosynthesis C-methylase UbiE
VNETAELIRRQWDRAARVYDGAIAPALADAHRAILTRVGDVGDRELLDLGCGTGRVAALAARRGARVTAVDLSPAMVERAGALPELAGARLAVMDAQALEFPDASFDLVVASFSVMFCPRPDSALAEARRVLRPGGRFAAGVWSFPEECEHAAVSAAALAAAPLAGGPEVPTGQALADPERLRTLLADAGFSNVRLERLRFTLRYPSADALWDAITEIYGERMAPDRLADAETAARAEIARLGLPLRSWSRVVSATA